jgi:hypothetical protein
VGFHLQPWNSLPGPTKAEGDQRFESISLHRRVGCEPDFPDHGCSISAPIAPRVDRDRLAQPFSGRSPISAIEDAGEPQAFCRTEFVGSAALAIQFRQKLQRWGGCGPNPFPHASFAGGTPMAARYAQKRPSSRWSNTDLLKFLDASVFCACYRTVAQIKRHTRVQKFQEIRIR